MGRKECWGESLKHCDPPLIVLVIVAIYQLVGLNMTVWVLFFVIHTYVHIFVIMTVFYDDMHSHLVIPSLPRLSPLVTGWLCISPLSTTLFVGWKCFQQPPPPSPPHTHPCPGFLSLHSACTQTHIHAQSQHAHTHTHYIQSYSGIAA